MLTSEELLLGLGDMDNGELGKLGVGGVRAAHCEQGIWPARGG